MRILLSAAYSIIEPLGLIYLAGLAKELGHQTRIVLVRDFDFRPLFERVEEFRPDLVGFNVYTGTHKPVYEAMRRLNAMGITTVMGGPHATYFAEDAAQYARHVVRGEGFTGFRHILEGTAPAGVFFDEKLLREGFPCPDRATFYDEHPLHRDNPIKNDITAVGCPWGCTYCFNVQFLKIYGAFRLVARPVEAVIAALEEIRQRWPTRLIFFQDDVFGFNIPWLEEFVRQYRDRVRIPWHAQIRLELTRDPRRLKLFKEGGCCGLTTAIESADPWVRKHLLDRDGMTNEEIVEGCARIKAAGLRLRTEQITALPTSDLDLDLATLRLNVAIKPDMAWNSIFAPYRGTDLGELAVRWGYYGGNNDDLSETFFDRSVLTFHWNDRYQTDPTQPNPARRPFGHEENERYRDQTVVLQALFNFFGHVPRGDELAERYLRTGDFSFAALGRMTIEHLATLGESVERTTRKTALRAALGELSAHRAEIFEALWPYFTQLPHGEKLAKRFFALDDLTLRTLSTATRHHLYDEVVYNPDPLPELVVAPVA